MVNKIINQFGDLTTLWGPHLTSSDPHASAGVFSSNVMMLRNESGVHAFAIDGYKHIVSSSTAVEANIKYGDVVVFRHLLSGRNLSNLGGNSNVCIGLENELNAYITENKEFVLKKLF